MCRLFLASTSKTVRSLTGRDCVPLDTTLVLSLQLMGLLRAVEAGFSALELAIDALLLHLLGSL